MKKCTKTANNRVTSVEPLSNRVEVTLKMSTAPNIPKSEIIDLSKFHVGDVVSGRIKRVESFGLFIAIDNTNMVFLQPWQPFLVRICNKKYYDKEIKK